MIFLALNYKIKLKRLFFQILLLFCFNLQAQIGVGITDSTSSLNVNNSVSVNITKTTTNLTLNDSHHTIVLSGNHTITLPEANTCPGRIYIIENPTNNIVTVSSYKDLIGAGSTIIKRQSTTKLKSDGDSWLQIKASKITY